MKKYTINHNLPKNLPLLLKSRVECCGDVNLQAAKNSEGKFKFVTYKKVYEKIVKLALALKKLGIKRGDNIGMISDNRQEWLVTDFAVQSLGCADVPRGCDSMGNEIRFILNFADCKYSFFENEKQILKVLDNIAEVPELKTVFSYDPVSEQTEKLLEQNKIQYISYEKLLEDGTQIFNQNQEAAYKLIEEEMNLTGLDDTATIIFTSGTTGTPKGVMLSHENYISQLSAVHNFMPGKQGSWWMTILPVWHSFERLAQYVTILLKSGLAYSKPNARVLLDDMAAIKPRWMCGVPRLWEALATGVTKKMEKQGGIVYALYKFFMNTATKYHLAKNKFLGNIFAVKKPNRVKDIIISSVKLLALAPVNFLGNILVFSKIRAKFGGKFVFPVSGGGALQPETDSFFRNIGFIMEDGYGMTETAPAIAFRNYKNPQMNCIGDVFPTIQVKIVKEKDGIIEDSTPLPYGEKGLILVKGGHVMKGYYKRPDLTEKIIDKDGWLNTGDLGVMSYKGELKITGRAKDTIVLLDGENIEPVLIEQALCASEYIESAMVVGQDRKFLSSLIVPVKSAIEAFAREHKIDFDSYENLLKNTLIHKFIMSIVEKHVSMEKGFRTCEKISKITLISKSFEVGKELSAKQEMMRHKIAEEYTAEIQEMYA